MPCESPYDGDYGKGEIDQLTRLLCEACKFLEDANILRRQTADLQYWWRQHKNLDTQRLAVEAAVKKQEKTKMNALKKLSLIERKALGLL